MSAFPSTEGASKAADEMVLSNAGEQNGVGEAAPSKPKRKVVVQADPAHIRMDDPIPALQSAGEGSDCEDSVDGNVEEAEEEASEETMLAALPDDTDEIDLSHSRLSGCSLSKLGLARFGPFLHRLVLRQNEINKVRVDDFTPLTELREVDFYDNNIKKLEPGGLGKQHLLEVLDLSFNAIRSLDGLAEFLHPTLSSELSQLHTLYFVQNKITSISGLQTLGARLRSLELGGNRIREIEGLDELVNLEELWLGKNKITKLQGLSKLFRLKILSIQSNRITKIEGLDELTSLEELYMSHNGLTKIEGLDKCKNLRVFDAAANKLEKIENVSHLSKLEEFWVNDNSIPDLSDLESQLAHLPKLETVYLDGNPLQRKEGSSYRRKVKLALPQVKQIDATYIR